MCYIIVKRNGTGNINLPTKNLITDDNYAISTAKALDLLANRVGIKSVTIPRGETWSDLIHKTDSGIYLIKGDGTVRYTASGQLRQFNANLHLIIIAEEANFKRIIHFYTSGLLSGYNEFDGELTSDLMIENNSTSVGLRVVSTTLNT